MGKIRHAVDKIVMPSPSLRYSVPVFALLSCLAIGTPSQGQTQPSDKNPTILEQSLTAAEKKLIDAKKKDDKAFFRQTLADDFTLVGVDGVLHEKQDAVDELGDTGLLEIRPYDLKVVPINEDAAIVTYDAVVREAPQQDQGPPPRYQHFSSVWVQQDGQWKLKFHQSSAAHWGDW
jgi:hypothetical protein